MAAWTLLSWTLALLLEVHGAGASSNYYCLVSNGSFETNSNWQNTVQGIRHSCCLLEYAMENESEVCGLNSSTYIKLSGLCVEEKQLLSNAPGICCPEWKSGYGSDGSGGCTKKQFGFKLDFGLIVKVGVPVACLLVACCLVCALWARCRTSRSPEMKQTKKQVRKEKEEPSTEASKEAPDAQPLLS
eukprot:CAMPEP_0197625552 /NCGR_PEP_ID=MMETSP1338-20131121/4888_1 /TAXON_ID=43686 ORGANISM="Pelagodinium beii, Strain RCC1491" /NCGR_SAMPLE_ID=MMETSP1338 /ASSEMBLY_ACC=CAM_ASM_000754 /LENGTH=186 /DNA_ID=CAMNT_0043195987 /DNA_START=41 /DNA_END=597 /DNA_ORIENTATION=+